ncbi:phospho-sugar mutase [Spiroplasma endosymbiont of Amphibalanus improvisus]|uniref:phospho-sugar mutase n=1 Tax=Spiroplasma endosymbiont of Amphibalanus improvisus TaxID=3066327 RepID=UPI00313CE2C6
MNYEKNYDLWKKNYSKLGKELQSMFDNLTETEKKEAFATELEFGTAGLRGILGAGTGRMNIFTVRRATLAFIKFLKSRFSEYQLKTKGIVIGCDNRKWGLAFQKDITQIFASFNIKTKIFPNDQFVPTPIISFSVKTADCVGGIVITASHNPKIYNGYKIYDENGCQYLPDETNAISKYYNVIQSEVFNNFSNDKKDLITVLDNSIRNKYEIMIKKMQFHPDMKKTIKIVFSNLHGTGRDWTPVILKELGYEVIIVAEQYEYDEEFTNAPKPNPEILSNYDLAIDYAKKNDADLIILNDPDADRIGIGVKTSDGKYQLLTGNETAPILLEYWLSQHKAADKLPTNAVMYNTFVTGDLSDRVAEKWGVKIVKTLTGFKWIGSRIPLEKQRNLSFIFGFEEAYGYVLNPATRDKDGIQSSIVLAEACNYFASKNKTMTDILEDIYQEFGYYYCFTVNEIYEGLEGRMIINKMLKVLRSAKIKTLNNLKCIKKEDYLDGLHDMPAQDLLKFYFEDGTWVAVRASGTEPKIKFYYVAVSKESLLKAQEKQEKMHNDLKNNFLNNL